jgi:hypothetical protein
MPRPRPYHHVVRPKPDPLSSLDRLPERWQLMVRAALAGRERRLERLAFQIDQVRSAVNARRTNIRRFLGYETPAPAFAVTGDFRGRLVDRSRSVAEADGGRDDDSDESRSRRDALDDVVEVLSADQDGSPSLVSVNRVLRDEGERRASQSELDQALERLGRSAAPPRARKAASGRTRRTSSGTGANRRSTPSKTAQRPRSTR